MGPPEVRGEQDPKLSGGARRGDVPLSSPKQTSKCCCNLKTELRGENAQKPPKMIRDCEKPNIHALTEHSLSVKNTEKNGQLPQIGRAGKESTTQGDELRGRDGKRDHAPLLLGHVRGSKIKRIPSGEQFRRYGDLGRGRP